MIQYITYYVYAWEKYLEIRAKSGNSLRKVMKFQTQKSVDTLHIIK